MTEYIKREDALKAMQDTRIVVTGMRVGKTILSEYANQCKTQYLQTINDIPGAEVEPVKRGRWITVGYTKYGSIIRKCSYCGIERKSINKSKYCRDCGAHMCLTDELDDQMSYLEE